MENKNESSESKTKKITLGLVLAWIFGISVGISAIVNLTNGQFLSGILFLVATLIIFPPAYKSLENKLKISLSGGLRTAIFIILLIIVASTNIESAGPSGNSNNNSVTPTSQSKEAIKVTAMKLISDYEANEVNADAKYKGNIVEVSGIVGAIGKDILDTPYITLKNVNEFAITDVQCMFSKENEPELSQVSKNQQITLRGEVSGKLGNVIVNNCSIVK